jgi:isocitrate dehydrogenase
MIIARHNMEQLYRPIENHASKSAPKLD